MALAQPEAAAFIQAQAHAVGAVVGGERPGVPNLSANGAGVAEERLERGAVEADYNDYSDNARQAGRAEGGLNREENVVEAWEGGVVEHNGGTMQPSVVESLNAVALDAEGDYQRLLRPNQVRTSSVK